MMCYRKLNNIEFNNFHEIRKNIYIIKQIIVENAFHIK
jgi:hypothetical protein